MGTPHLKFEDKFIPEPNGGCWLWLGPLRNGRGRHRRKAAHRYSWEKYRGKIPEGLCVLHKCDIGSCVNPNHLFLGTILDNIRDMDNKGRRRWHIGKKSPETIVRGELRAHVKLTTANVLEIKRMLNEGLTPSEIAPKYNVSSAAIRFIKIGRNWAHVGYNEQEE